MCFVWAVTSCAVLVAGWTTPASATTTPDRSGLLSLKVTAEKSQVYPGEAVPVTIKLEYPESLTVRDIQYPQVLHPGLSIREAGSSSLKMELKNGTSWSSMEFTYLVSGGKAGEFILGPVTLTCSLLLPAAATGSQGFFGDAEPQRCHLMAEGVAFTVIPFPLKGKPRDFSGAVGDFRIGVTVKPREVRAGDPVTVTTTIAGDGVIETVACPLVEARSDIKVYPTQTRRMRGKVVCEQILIPADETVRQIPPVSFSFFDPRLGSYRTVREGPFPLTVISANSTKKVANPTPAFPVISGALTAPPADPGRPAGYRTYITVVSGMALVALLGFSIRQFRRSATPSSSRYELEIIPQESPLEPSLELVEIALADNDSGRFHTAVFRIVQEILGNHCHVAPQAITAEIVETHLRPEGNSDLVIDMVQTLFRECDRVRYSCVRASGAEMEATCRRLKELRHCLKTGIDMDRCIVSSGTTVPAGTKGMPINC
jgi:hypothetical protein